MHGGLEAERRQCQEIGAPLTSYTFFARPKGLAQKAHLKRKSIVRQARDEGLGASTIGTRENTEDSKLQERVEQSVDTILDGQR